MKKYLYLCLSLFVSIYLRYPMTYDTVGYSEGGQDNMLEVVKLSKTKVNARHYPTHCLPTSRIPHQSRTHNPHLCKARHQRFPPLSLSPPLRSQNTPPHPTPIFLRQSSRYHDVKGSALDRHLLNRLLVMIGYLYRKTLPR